MDKKYILTNETMNFCARTLYRIKAVKNFGHINIGELGGWVESEKNLAQYDNCWISEKALVFGDAQVYGDAQVFGDAKIYEKARTFGNAKVYGEAQVYGKSQIFGEAQVYGKAQIYGEAAIYDEAQIFGDAGICEKALVCGNALVYGKTKVCANAKIHFKACLKDIGDYICIGPIGSRDDCATFYRTENGEIWVYCGCFNDSIENFERAVKKAHGNSHFAQQYKIAIRNAKELIELS